MIPMPGAGLTRADTRSGEGASRLCVSQQQQPPFTILRKGTVVLLREFESSSSDPPQASTEREEVGEDRLH